LLPTAGGYHQNVNPLAHSAPEARPSGVARLDTTLRGTAALQDMRVSLRALATGALGPQRLSDALIAATELATNSLVHAGPGAVTVRASRDRRRLRVEVHDAGPGIGSRRLARPPATSVGGRGLYLVTKLADRWGSRDRPRAMVWFEIDREAVTAQ
jgi:anti-sigma regulatory factor (Ser/Thr protein kinase)